MKITFTLLLLLFGISLGLSQNLITGQIVDKDGNEPLLGANIMVRGTSSGTVTDIDGKFRLSVEKSSGILTVSYLGYVSREIPYNVSNGETDLGNIQLTPDDSALDAIVVTGVMDLAKDRETPVAVSTIRAEEIQEKLGSQELPEILNRTPSIYATKQGGGFGDARINIRGFDTQNSAVMINGVPVNDMENGQVYWSNWAGLSDVASAIQVQRGLGSSKLAISSVGGTINVVTRSSNRPQGGFIRTTLGNDGYNKVVASYSTGLGENGWSSSYLLSRAEGDMWADGLAFEGFNYFMAVGYVPNADHQFEFTVTGAPQWHHQRSRAIAISEHIRYGEGGNPDRRYNDQWGTRDGEQFSFRRNFYHKPIISLNWDYNISEQVKLTTTTYASFGRGGGTGEIGEIGGRRQFALPRTSAGLVRVDDIISYNGGEVIPDFNNGSQRDQLNGLYLNNSDQNANSDETNGITRRASINSHNWYGILANLNYEITDALTVDFGIDLRNYTGYHYRRVNDLLGGDAYQQTDDRNNPLTGDSQTNIFREEYSANQPWWVFADIDDEEKIDYYNIGYVNWAGIFGQAEYKVGDITAFVQGALANQGYAREELFGVAPPEKTDYENLLGGNVKGGLNYNIDEKNNVFANAGYYSKQPLFDAVFLNFSNTVNPNLENEEIIGVELGYGFRSDRLRANLNVYRTSWANRFESVNARFNEGTPEEIQGTANLLGIKQVHIGAELDAQYRVMDKLMLRGMLSVGDWQYEGDVTATYFDNDQQPISVGGVEQEATLELDGVKVGDAAQLTAAAGAQYSIFDFLSVDADYRYADNLYAQFDATDVDADFEAIELPSFSLVDVGATVRVPFGEADMNIRVNVNNVFDTVYIAESDTSRPVGEEDETYDGINTSNRVFFGFGRTWNASLMISF